MAPHTLTPRRRFTLTDIHSPSRIPTTLPLSVRLLLTLTDIHSFSGACTTPPISVRPFLALPDIYSPASVTFTIRRRIDGREPPCLAVAAPALCRPHRAAAHASRHLHAPVRHPPLAPRLQHPPEPTHPPVLVAPTYAQCRPHAHAYAYDVSRTPHS